MKISNTIFFIIYFSSFTPVFCSSDDNFSDTTSSGGSPIENRTPRSCSANDWLDELALNQRKKPKQPSTTSRAISPLLNKSDELTQFKEQLDKDRDILRASAEALLEHKARCLEDELLFEWSEYWRQACDNKETASVSD